MIPRPDRHPGSIRVARNAAAIPLAALAMLPPGACAAAMAVSDISRIGNSLRLLRMGRK